MAITSHNVLLGIGEMYVGAFGATEPLDTAVGTAPDDAIWTSVGATSGGLTVNVNQTFTPLTVDQKMSPVGQRLTERTISVSTQLAEGTLENLKTAINGGTITTGGSGGTAWKKLTPLKSNLAVVPTYIAIIVDGFAPGLLGSRRRFVGRKALSTDAVEYGLSKTDMTTFGLTLTLQDVSDSVDECYWVDKVEA